MSQEYITESEMRRLLREAYARDPEKSLLANISRNMGDPAMPRDEKNRRRIHPLLLTIGLAFLLMTGVFFYFSFVK